MPRTKKQQFEPQSQQPSEELQNNSQEALQTSNDTIQFAQSTVSSLFEKKLAMDGQECADRAWDAFSESFVSTCETRFAEFVNVLLPELQTTFNRLQQSSTDRRERQQGIMKRIQALAINCEATQKSLVPSPMGFVDYEETPLLESGKDNE